MGRQIRFVMSNEDEERFVEFILSHQGACILSYRHPLESTILYKDMSKFGDTGNLHLWIWRSDMSPEPTYDVFNKQKFRTINEMRSEVIEFSRSLGIWETLEG